MKLRLVNIFLIFIVSTYFYSCDTDSESEVCVYQPDISDISLDFEYERLTNEFLSINKKRELKDFLDQHPVIKNYFLRKYEYPDDSVFFDQILQRITNPHIDTLQMEVNRVFGEEQELKEEFIKAFKHLKYYYPDANIPKVKTIATGFEQDMFFTDSLIIVGLDYYLGQGAKYRPRTMYEYILQRYAPEYIVPSVMLIYGISPRFNKTGLEDKTVLADMIAYGKAFYFAKHMMPCTPDSVMIWYSSEEIKGVRENADIIWGHFLENDILYETSHEIKRKYIEERPKTYEIGEAAPGRIGTWLGWQIVRAYMERNEEVTLPELMETKDPKRIFNESKYRPE
ncbi:MAG: gliding motility lipoprotein GldB [Candidatus Cyclobacteriaceae bacterium M2_1C_046]